eukprot:scaffold175734_cov28-Tisochrysis_lutea.AAC.2
MAWMTDLSVRSPCVRRGLRPTASAAEKPHMSCQGGLTQTIGLPEGKRSYTKRAVRRGGDGAS